MNATAATQAKPEPRPWLAHYPPAVPPEIGDPGYAGGPDRPRLPELWDTSRFRELRQGDQLRRDRRAARAFAAWLQAQGYRKGDRIALMMPNILAYPATIFARYSAATRSSTSTRSIRRASWRISSTIPALGCSS